MIARLSNVALALVLAGLSLAQERDDKPVYVPPRTFGPIDFQVHEDMQGIWKFERLEWAELGLFQGRDLEGFMLIDEGHIAFEIHAFTLGDADERLLLFQSGVWRYQFTPVGELEMISMIGCDNRVTVLGFDLARTGESTRYKVRLAGDVLHLDRQSARFTLRRVPSPKPPFHDRIPRPEAQGEGKK
jgi:hypothetical protein